MLSLFPQLLDFGTLGPVFLRIGLAVVFIAHGYPKLFKKDNFLGTAQFFESINIKPGKFWVMIVGVVEFFGGILLFAGLFTQLVALLLVVDMLVAIWKVNFKKGLVRGYEFELILLLSALALVVLGAGAFSLDLPL
ncbi:MAG TPA: DoxX family protein [Candidatus Paceibacterota bacterium]